MFGHVTDRFRLARESLDYRYQTAAPIWFFVVGDRLIEPALKKTLQLYPLHGTFYIR
jgi:hypothetical protein